MNKISNKDHAELTELQDTAAQAVEAYKIKLEELQQRATDYFDEKSERWQESDRGQDYRSWVDDMEAAVSEIDSFELPDVPSQEPG